VCACTSAAGKEVELNHWSRCYGSFKHVCFHTLNGYLGCKVSISSHHATVNFTCTWKSHGHAQINGVKGHAGFPQARCTNCTHPVAQKKLFIVETRSIRGPAPPTIMLANTNLHAFCNIHREGSLRKGDDMACMQPPSGGKVWSKSLSLTKTNSVTFHITDPCHFSPLAPEMSHLLQNEVCMHG